MAWLLISADGEPSVHSRGRSSSLHESTGLSQHAVGRSKLQPRQLLAEALSQVLSLASAIDHMVTAAGTFVI